MRFLRSLTFPVLFLLLNSLCACHYCSFLINSCTWHFALLILFLFLIIILVPWLQFLFFSADYPRFLSVSTWPSFLNWWSTDVFRFHNSHQLYILWETWIFFCFFLFLYDSHMVLVIEVQNFHLSFPSCHILSLAKLCSAFWKVILHFLFPLTECSLHYFFFHAHLVFGPFPPCTAESILCFAIRAVFKSGNLIVIFSCWIRILISLY